MTSIKSIKGFHQDMTCRGIVGRDGIKSGVWYKCEGGKLVEAMQ